MQLNLPPAEVIVVGSGPNGLAAAIRMAQAGREVVVVEGAHECMTTRGVHKPEVTMVTSCMLGSFRTRAETRHEFLSAINLKGAARTSGSID